MDTPVESVSVTRAAPAKPKPNKRRARVQIDKRFFLGRRIAQLTAIFAERAGLDDANDPDPMLQAAVEKAARLVALTEDATAKATKADPRVSLDDVVRLSRMSDLAVRRLRLDDRRNTKTQPGLADLLRGGSS